MLMVLALGCLTFSFAQRPGGRGPGGRNFNTEDMILREKENVIAKIDNLSKDQLLLLNGIYEEFGITFKEIFEEMRKTRNRTELRPKVEALRVEKNLLVKDVLDKDQYVIYLSLIEKQRGQRRQGDRTGRKDSTNSPNN